MCCSFKVGIVLGFSANRFAMSDSFSFKKNDQISPFITNVCSKLTFISLGLSPLATSFPIVILKQLQHWCLIFR